MKSIVMNAAGLGASFLFVFATLSGANSLTNAGRIGSRTSRKAIHIALAHWWLIAIVLFDDPWVASVGPALGLLGSLLAPLVPAEHGAARRADRGPVCYSLALLILVNLSWRGLISPRSAAIGVFTMGWGDGLAGLIGSRFGKGGITIWGRKKTMPGTSAMFVASFVVAFLCVLISGFPGLAAAGIASASTAAVATALELLTPWGMDNLVISLGTTAFFAGVFG